MVFARERFEEELQVELGYNWQTHHRVPLRAT